MKIEINGADFAMVQRAVADKKDPRKYLQHILLDATTSLAVGANGHIMVQAPFELVDPIDVADRPHASVLVRLDNVIPKRWESKLLILDTEAKTLTCPLGTLPILVQPPGESPEPLHFPTYQRVSAHGSGFTPAPVERIAFDPSILQAVTKQHLVRFTFQANSAGVASDAIRVDVRGSNARITFMPCYLKDWSNS